jgi:hypothetical protein
VARNSGAEFERVGALAMSGAGLLGWLWVVEQVGSSCSGRSAAFVGQALRRTEKKMGGSDASSMGCGSPLPATVEIQTWSFNKRGQIVVPQNTHKKVVCKE